RDPAQIALGTRMRLVLQAHHAAPATVVVAHRADEEGRTTRGEVAHGGVHLVQRERGVAQREQADRVLGRHASMMAHRTDTPAGRAARAGAAVRPGAAYGPGGPARPYRPARPSPRPPPAWSPRPCRPPGGRPARGGRRPAPAAPPAPPRCRTPDATPPRAAGCRRPPTDTSCRRG